jgi:type III secretion system (T3SS) SseB-like protein
MGLLDTWARRAMERRDEKADFLGAQHGPVEETLKRELILEFATRPVIRRAYLASVAFPQQTGPSPALCIVSDRPDDKSIVVRVGEILRRRFDKDVPLDVIFLTAEQEAAVARVCAPFYRSPIVSTTP